MAVVPSTWRIIGKTGVYISVASPDIGTRKIAIYPMGWFDFFLWFYAIETQLLTLTAIDKYTNKWILDFSFKKTNRAYMYEKQHLYLAVLLMVHKLNNSNSMVRWCFYKKYGIESIDACSIN